MVVVTGVLLVLLSWAVLVALLAAVGTPLSVLTHRGPVSRRDLRRGLWWGLLAFAVGAMLGGNFVSLSSPVVALSAALLALIGAAAMIVLIRRRGWHASWGFTPSYWILVVLVVAVVAYLATAALGPVTNFDSGLYHLSAISHAADYPAIPGLANLYAPLGYANANFPMSAALASSPWSDEGFRLLNGLIISLVLLDLMIRWATRRPGAGAYGLLVGSVVLAIPMVALSDYWVTSPSQDSSVFAVTVAVSGMLMTAIGESRQRIAELSTAVAGSLLLVLLRPTMSAFLLAVVAVALVLVVRHRALERVWRGPLVLVAGAGLLSAIAQTSRDYVLSGWLLYPLSILPFDVPWRASDPIDLRTATLGYHRDPTDLWAASDGWAWIGPWFSRLTAQWETAVVVALAVATTVAALGVARLGISVRWRALALAMIPSAATTVVWWLFTPPSFRFAWGPVFTLFTIPLGWLLWRAAVSRRRDGRPLWATWAPLGAATMVLLVVAYSATVRLDVPSMASPRSWEFGVSIPYVVAPVEVPPTVQVAVEPGLTVLSPMDENLCWGAHPFCTTEAVGGLRLVDPAQGPSAGLRRY